MKTITITQEDIDTATVHDPRSCVLVKALNRHGYKHVEVGGINRYDHQGIIRLFYPDQKVPFPFLTTFPLSPEATQYAHNFDLGQKVEPCSFELDLPEIE